MTGPGKSRRNLARIAGVAAIAMVCVLAAYALHPTHRSLHAAVKVARQDAPAVPQAVAPGLPIEAGRLTPAYDRVADARTQPAPQPKVERFKLDRPVSIVGLLRDAGLDKPQRELWAQAFRSSAHWGILSPGHQVALFKDPDTGQVQALEYTLDQDSVIRARALSDGAVFATRETLTYQPQTVAYTLSLARGLETAAAQKHLPMAVVEQIKDVFGTRLPRPGSGATLKLIYNVQVTPDGSHRRDVDLKACKLQLGGRSFCAFSFHDEHGREHLYDEHGNPLEPQFLRFPVVFKYISSTFSESRYHPILHRFRPHVGVDLAASYGTPVKAVGDGTVQFAGWDGELGRCIRLEHDKNLVSVYGHLSGINPAVKAGAPVRIGEVIGYVGSSGLSTGPHLHFAIFKDGRFVDPLTTNFDDSGAIPTDRRPLFERTKHQYEKVLAGLHGFKDAAVDPSIISAFAFDNDTDPPPIVVDRAPSKARARRPRVARREQRPHLVRGGVLREGGAKDTDDSALARFIKGGLSGDPSM